MARKLQIIGNLLAGEIDSEKVKQIVDDYLDENPPVPQITINGEGPDENGNFVVEVQSGSGSAPGESDGNNVVEF